MLSFEDQMNCENIAPVQKTTEDRPPFAEISPKRLRAKRSSTKTGRDRKLVELPELENVNLEQKPLLAMKTPKLQNPPPTQPPKENSSTAPTPPRFVADEVDRRFGKERRQKRRRVPLADITHIIRTIEALREAKRKRLEEAGEAPIEAVGTAIGIRLVNYGVQTDENGVPVATNNPNTAFQASTRCSV